MRIPVTHGHLEALLKEPTGAPTGAGVMCHPHPVYGGTMHTKAVYRAAQAFNDAGIVALRFNFRGVGTSTGSHDDGIGEEEDVRAAIDWLEARYPELPLLAGGFSFGSLVGMRVGAADDRVVGLLGLGLPIDKDQYDYTFLSDASKPVLVVQGENDEFGSGDAVAGLIPEMGAHITLVRVGAADHYFTDHTDELREIVCGYYESGPGSRLLAVL